MTITTFLVFLAVSHFLIHQLKHPEQTMDFIDELIEEVNMADRDYNETTYDRRLRLAEEAKFLEDGPYNSDNL